MRHALLIFAAPLVLLAACASADPPQHLTAADDREPGLTPYGMFLAGEAALNDGRSREAARYFDQARIDPEAEGLISERAFTAALLAGEVEKAASLAPSGDEASEAGKRLGALVLAVEAIADGKGKQAQALLASNTIGFPHKSAAALLAPWAAAQAGDVEASVVLPQVKGDRMVDYFGQLDQGLLFERARRYDEAETDLKAAAGGDRPSELSVLAYGGFLERRGRRAEAVTLYDAILAADPDNRALVAAKARAAAGRPAPAAPTINEGAAQALLAPAATMMAAKQGQLAEAYLRLALRLDPDRNDAWVMIGDVMAGDGDMEQARLAYSRPKPGSPEFPSAQAKLAWTYEQAGDHDTALKIARAAAATGDADARLTLADLLRANNQCAPAAELLDGLIAAQASPDWRLYFARAVCNEQLDRWSAAETDLQAALKLEPDEPELLNYLGYAWIDRGVHLQEALGMVQRAVAQNPRSGAMIDSLGWAYFKLGDYKKAVEKLEQAVEIEAGDPEINNHLGDAYWRAGRRDEALFQWRRVLTLNPDARIKAEVEGKIAAGPEPRIAPARIAGQ